MADLEQRSLLKLKTNLISGWWTPKPAGAAPWARSSKSSTHGRGSSGMAEREADAAGQQGG